MKHSRYLRRTVSVLLSALLLLPAAALVPAAAAEAIPAGTAYVDAAAEGSVTFSFGGREYAGTVGTDVFKTLKDALAAIPAGGTLWLAPGNYSEGLVINKDVTILGPKAGIDPNVRGAKPDDDWTRSPERGTGEAVLTTSWHMGINANTKEVYDCHAITVDGLALTGAAMFRSNFGEAGEIRLTYKNLYVYGYTTKNNGPLYFTSYYPDQKTNKYVRRVTLENIRFEGQTTAPGCNLTVAELTASGIYFDATSTGKFIPAVSIPDASVWKEPVTVTVKDSMFRQKVNQVLNLNFKTGAQYTFNNGIGSLPKVTAHVENCVFWNNDSKVASNNNILVPQIDTDNVYFEIVGNRFIQENAADNYIAIHGATSALALGEKFTIRDNVFIGIPTALNIPSSTTPFDLSGNYFCGADGKAAKPVSPSLNVAEWWYLDEAMTQKSTDQQDVLDGKITSGTVDAAAKTVKADASGDSFTFTMTSEAYNKLNVYADPELTKELGATVRLYNTENTFYLKVSSMTGNLSEVYTATVTTTAPDKLGYDIANEVKLLGRTYAENGKFFFNWSASGFSFNFKGSGAKATILSTGTGGGANAYLKIYVDGKEMADVELTQKEQTVTLASGLDANVAHNVTVQKRTNGRSSYAAVTDIRLLDGEKLAQPADSARRIEFIGDSLTVGYASIAGSATAWSTATEDVSKTYVKNVADYFGADYSVVAISGRGVVRNTGGDTDRLMPAIYGDLDNYNAPGVAYDFAVQPDVIVINLGTNDASGNNPNLTDAEFKAGMLAFLKDVRAKNPNAEIIWAYGLTTLKFYQSMQAAVTELNNAGDAKVHFLMLDTCTGAEKALGHPTEAGYKKSTASLISTIASLTGWTEAAEPINKAPDVPTDAPTEAPTAAPTEAPANTDAPDTKPAEEKKGCKSAAAAGALAALLGTAAVLPKKKKED